MGAQRGGDAGSSHLEPDRFASSSERLACTGGSLWEVIGTPTGWAPHGILDGTVLALCYL
jgi:hypothetical protein